MMDHDIIDDEGFNMSMRRFLKKVGVTSQHEIERIARQQTGSTLRVKMVLTAEGTELNHTVEGEIDLGSFSKGKRGAASS